MAEGLIRHPAYPWPEGYRAAVVFSADVDVESPFQWANRGKPVTMLGEIEQRRFGPRRGLLRIVDVLAEFDAKGSFYVPGAVMEAYPWIVPGLLAEGHEVGLHGYFHERVDTLDDAAFADVMESSLAIYRTQGGPEPVGFRSPSWELAPNQVAYLKRPEILYDSSLMGMDHPYRLDGLTEIPVHWPVDDAPYYRFFGGGRDTSPPTSPASLLQDWLFEFDAVAAAGGLFMITIHPWMSGRASRTELLRRLFAHIRQRDDIWWTTSAEIARWHTGLSNTAQFDFANDPVSTEF